MSAPTVTSVTAASPAARAGLAVGDELLSIDGQEPRDVIDFQRLSDAGDLSVLVRRAGAPLPRVVRVDKEAGEPLGVEVSSAVFDRIRTCDNHCAFCFIYQLPKGMRRSLYLKDDDYRLSFLYGNFTTLTRFTELDAERILTERLGPAVRVHPHHRPRPPRPHAAQSRRAPPACAGWRSCSTGASRCTGRSSSAPGSTTAPRSRTPWPGSWTATRPVQRGRRPAGAQPLLQRARDAPPHPEEAEQVLDTIDEWQGLYKKALGHRMVFAADEYYLLAGRELPPARSYEGYPQHENGIGMARAFAEAFTPPVGRRPGRRAPRLLRLRRRGPGRRVPGPAAAHRAPAGADDAGPSTC